MAEKHLNEQYWILTTFSNGARSSLAGAMPATGCGPIS